LRQRKKQKPHPTLSKGEGFKKLFLSLPLGGRFRGGTEGTSSLYALGLNFILAPEKAFFMIIDSWKELIME